MMVAGLRVAVIGNEFTTDASKVNQPFTLYRTVITYNDEWYERLIRYREFRAFYRTLRLFKGDKMLTRFPQRFCTRWGSLSNDVIESRQVELDNFMRELCRKDLPASTQDHLFYLLKIGKYEQHHKDPRFGGRSRCSEESSTNRTLSSDASTNTSHQISGTATTVVTGTACSSLITSKESISVPVPEETVESTSPDTGTTLPLPPLEVAPSVAPATSQSEDVVITEEDIDDPPDPLCPQTQRPILSNILTEEERSQLAELRASCLTDDESYSSRVMSSLRKIDDLLSNESKELEEIKSQLISSSIK